MLNILVEGDVSKEPYDKNFKICWRSSKGSTRNETMPHGASTNILKSSNTIATSLEIGNLLENLKTYIMRLLPCHLDVSREKHK